MDCIDARRKTLIHATELDAAATRAETRRSAASSAAWVDESALRSARSCGDADAVAQAATRLRGARAIVTSARRERDALCREAGRLRESVGDYVSPAALSTDYRVRYAAAASPYSTSATLIQLGRDAVKLVAVEAGLTWAEYRPGRPPLNQFEPEAQALGTAGRDSPA